MLSREIMLWILNNWRIVMWGLLALSLLALLLLINHWRNQSNLYVSEKAAHSRDIEACKANQQFTKESSHALDSDLNAIDDYYGSLLESSTNMHPADSSGQHDAATCPNKPSELTLQQQRFNDRQAAQLVNCQATICHIYKINGQEDLLPAGVCKVD